MWYIHIFALFELYLVQFNYKTKLSCCTPHRHSTTVSLEAYLLYLNMVSIRTYGNSNLFESDLIALQISKMLQFCSSDTNFIAVPQCVEIQPNSNSLKFYFL